MNVAMWSAIQMTEPKMSCDGCYHLIQVTMEVANANANVNTNTICLEIVDDTKVITHTITHMRSVVFMYM